MELRTLRYFLTVAREGNITHAAETLHVTQPALSRQLKQLESELGVELFTRNSRSISLTGEGRLLKQRAEDIVNMADDTSALFSPAADVITGNVRIGAGESSAFQVLAKAAEMVHMRHPYIQFHVYDGNEEDLADRLLDGLLDFCLLVQPTDFSKFNHKPISQKDTWGLLTRDDDPLARKAVITVDDLEGVPLFLSRQAIEGSYSNNDFLDWFGDKYERLNVIGTYNIAYDVSRMVVEGLGSILLLEGTAWTREGKLAWRPLSPRLTAQSEIAWKHHRALSPAASEFLKAVEELEGAVSEEDAGD